MNKQKKEKLTQELAMDFYLLFRNQLINESIKNMKKEGINKIPKK